MKNLMIPGVPVV